MSEWFRFSIWYVLASQVNADPNFISCSNVILHIRNDAPVWCLQARSVPISVVAIPSLSSECLPEHWASDMGIDCLAVIAVLVFPRLAFVTLKNNLMVLSLRAMIMQFAVLMCIAVFCFAGFFYALWT